MYSFTLENQVIREAARNKKKVDVLTLDIRLFPGKKLWATESWYWKQNPHTTFYFVGVNIIIVELSVGEKYDNHVAKGNAGKFMGKTRTLIDQIYH